jgi:hypothetical protein
MIGLLIAALVSTSTVVRCDGSDVAARLEQCGLIELTPGTCKLSRMVDPPCVSKIRAPHPELTRIEAAKNAHGFHFGLKAKHSVLEGVTIVGRNVTTTASITVGVLMTGPARLRDVHITNFVQGVSIHAAARRPGSTALTGEGSNGWALDNVWIFSTAHRAVYVDGPDVNVGSATELHVISGCINAKRWERDLGECACVYESSFFGNTWSGASVEECLDKFDRDANGALRPKLERFRRAYIADGLNQRAVFVNPYIEAANHGLTSPLTTVLGGHGGWIGPGMRIEGQRMHGGFRWQLPGGGELVLIPPPARPAQ